MWTNDDAERFGATLRRLRGERDLTQEGLAHRAEITKNQVQLLEAGRGSGRKDSVSPATPRIKTLAGLASALDLSISDLLAESGL